MPRSLVAALALCLLTVVACSDADQPSGPEPAEAPTASAAPEPPTPAERLGLAEGWGPTQAQLEAAARQVRRWSVPDLAGQVIVASYRGTQPPVRLVRSLHLGGVIVFSDNVTSPRQIAAANATLKRQVGRPLIVSVDQEGGIVARVDATTFPTFMSAGAAGDADLTRATYAAAGAELAGLGFTMDFAPDADVTVGPQDPAIGSRAASGDPQAAAEHSVAAAEGFLGSGVVPVLKHFPGHGSVTTDSHRALPVQGASLARLRQRDLVPFAAGVDAGLPAVMVGHIAVSALRPGLPASLAKPVITGLLRRDLGFDGLVVTDALDMRAVSARFGPGDAAVRALEAGADVLLMPSDPAAARAAIVRAVRSGALPRTRVEQAAARMLALQAHQAAEGTVEGAGPEATRAASRKLSAAAITMVAGNCRPTRVLGSAVTPVGDPEAVGTFAAAASAAGLDVLYPRAAPRTLTRVEPRPERRTKEKPPAFQKRVQAWQQRERERRADLAAWEAAEDARLAAGTSVGFDGYGNTASGADVTVAVDTPYVLGEVSSPVRIATYGENAAAMSVLLDVLLGKARAPGRLPVDVPGAPRRGC